MIEIKTVHLGANQSPINLFGGRPAAVIHRIEPLPQLLIILVTFGKCLSGVIRCAIKLRRALERPPLAEQFQQVAVLARSCFDIRLASGGTESQQYDEEDEPVFHDCFCCIYTLLKIELLIVPVLSENDSCSIPIERRMLRCTFDMRVSPLRQ